MESQVEETDKLESILNVDPAFSSHDGFAQNVPRHNQMRRKWRFLASKCFLCREASGYEKKTCIRMIRNKKVIGFHLWGYWGALKPGTRKRAVKSPFLSNNAFVGKKGNKKMSVFGKTSLEDALEVVLFTNGTQEQKELRMSALVMSYRRMPDFVEFSSCVNAIWSNYKSKVNKTNSDALKNNLAFLLKEWFTLGIYEIEEGEKCLAVLAEVCPSDQVAPIKQQYQLKVIERANRKNKLLSSSSSKSNSSFMSQNPEDIAKGLTLIQWRMFAQIKSSELLCSSMDPASKAKIAPNLVAMTERFDLVSYWIGHKILMAGGLKKQASMIEKFTKVLEWCVNLNNYETAMQVLSATNLFAIRKLKDAWKLVSEDTKNKLRDFEETMSPLKNFGRYRALLQNRDPNSPVLPCFAIFIKDVVQTCEGNADQPLEARLELLGSLFKNLQKLQKTPYKLTVDEILLSFVTHLEKYDENSLNALANVLERDDHKLNTSPSSEIRKASLEKLLSSNRRLSRKDSNASDDSEGTGSNTPRSDSSLMLSRKASEEVEDLESSSVSSSLELSSSGSLTSQLVYQMSHVSLPRENSLGTEVPIPSEEPVPTISTPGKIRCKAKFGMETKLLGWWDSTETLKDLQAMVSSKFNKEGLHIVFVSPNNDLLRITSDWQFSVAKQFVGHFGLTSVKLDLYETVV